MTTEDGSVATERQGSTAWQIVGAILIRVLPIVVAFLAFYAAGKAQPTLSDLSGLLQISIALLAGITAYTVENEIFLRRVPGQVRRETQRLESNLTVLSQRVDQFSLQITRMESVQQIKALFDVDEALEYARQLQSEAQTDIWAMWTHFPYDDDLRDYYADTLAVGKKLGRRTVRIVDADKVELEDLLDHIRASWDYLTVNSYEIYIAHHLSFEAMLVDFRDAGLFLYPPDQTGCCFINMQDERFVKVTRSLLEGLKRPDARLPVPYTASIEAIEQELVPWLEGQYS